MRRHELTLSVSPHRGALLRALALVERRGFHVVEVHATERDGVVDATVIVETSARSPENLCYQLAKLTDVHDARH